ncbi:D-tyrosyl-tRNA(Tyr) deacylase [Geomonas sp. Red69]|uniref:D-aminoacyl-tRNA deacylase n=1 Tax=Geomonas diazotrophica TaxID=2843197 RepID=A0ABX8JJG9_9BACT|nr:MULTISPECIES: D-aminoacyl-tRNA deacylase [Geomonas]MBU5635167.1 D-tyrosyl-tRNA(Tyr) deacylase [Geomonas diazotrophica]QWV97784.1 D-tyrosyl-tRNA(Tyr) deacylase [Geomonas nitrogeniifigens]QXE86924.1 D-tyrosyl-tRNA(Tyr) deacylase [Geomonas nitrogeniifigens]
MKAVIQRVKRASVTVAGKVVGEIGPGVLVLLGVEIGDTCKQADWMAEKIVNLRIFTDDQGKMNLALPDVKGEMLAVSQFTLAGNCSKGRRPSFDTAAAPEEANKLYSYFMGQVWELGVPVQSGIFQADMEVSLVNDGPVTFVLETPPNR